MIDKKTETAFVNKVRDALDEGAEGLDPSIVSRLNQARFEALEAGAKGGGGSWRGVNFRLAGAVVACGILLTVGLLTYRSNTAPIYYSGIYDVDILASSDGLELYEDMDFYAWLAQERDHAG